MNQLKNNTKKRRSIIRSIPFILLVCIVISYAIFNTRIFLEGPTITVISPENGSSFFDPRIIIEGQVKHIKNLFLDDRQINISYDKKFKEKLLLLPGYNIITLRGVDAFGRSRTKTLELVLLEDLRIDKLEETVQEVPIKATSSVMIEESTASTTE